MLLDVVYNHFGPDGNYLSQYSADYVTDRHQTPWGDAVNFDGQNARFVRDFVIDNAIQWVRDYRFDGLRLDAVDTIQDDSDPHILTEFQARVRASVDREIVLVAEDARNEVRTITPAARGGDGFDAFWADDFHHEMRVLLSNAWENYYADYTGSVADLASALNDGIIYQGQVSNFWGRPRGTTVTDEPANAFVFEMQNHDQVGNRPFGERLHHEIDRERFHAASAVLLLAPETPLIFMGQEFAASTPFLFFTDHHEELGPLVTEGRQNEFSGFRAFALEEAKHAIPDPQDEATFHASKLRLSERASHSDTYRLYQRLFALRHGDPVFQVQDRSRSHAQPAGGKAAAAAPLARRRASRADRQLRRRAAPAGPRARPRLRRASRSMDGAALHRGQRSRNERPRRLRAPARIGCRPPHPRPHRRPLRLRGRCRAILRRLTRSRTVVLTEDLPS